MPSTESPINLCSASEMLLIWRDTGPHREKREVWWNRTGEFDMPNTTVMWKRRGKVHSYKIHNQDGRIADERALLLIGAMR